MTTKKELLAVLMKVEEAKKMEEAKEMEEMVQVMMQEMAKGSMLLDFAFKSSTCHAKHNAHHRMYVSMQNKCQNRQLDTQQKSKVDPL